MKWKANIVRIALVLLLIVLGIFLYKVGKGKDVFFDNKEIAIDGSTYAVTSSYIIYVDDQKVGEVYQDARQAAMLVAGKHKIELDVLSEDGSATGQKLEYTFQFKENGNILNIPALIGGAKNFVLPPEPVE